MLGVMDMLFEPKLLGDVFVLQLNGIVVVCRFFFFANHVGW
jgi:hypothetical protein